MKGSMYWFRGLAVALCKMGLTCLPVGGSVLAANAAGTAPAIDQATSTTQAPPLVALILIAVGVAALLGAIAYWVLEQRQVAMARQRSQGITKQGPGNREREESLLSTPYSQPPNVEAPRFCRQCGREFAPADRFCGRCGTLR